MTFSPDARGHAPIPDLVQSYIAADYRWQHEGDWHDLQVGLPVPAMELLHGDVDTFGLLSAWNPYSIERTELANRDADYALHEALKETGMPFCAAFASAPNRTWREPSWVVMGLAVEDFDTLSRRFGQLGTLWWTRGTPVRLRIDAARPEGFDDGGCVDWLK